MRKIGPIADSKHRESFRWYLLKQGIRCAYREGDDPYIWVMDDDDRQRAQDLLSIFVLDPENTRYVGGSDYIHCEEPPEPVRVIKPRGFRRPRPASDGNTQTIVMIVLCSICFLLQFFDPGQQLRSLLWYSQTHVGPALGLGGFHEIAQGQVWRLVTPAFLHKNLLHLLFNMVWLYQFAGPIERRTSGPFLWLLVLLCAAFSNTAFYLVAGPSFEGMSGVVYGLVAYAAAMDRFSPQSPYGIDEGLVRFFLIWYVVCWLLSAVGMHVANTIHGFGALTGIAVAWVHVRVGSRRVTSLRTSWKDRVYTILIGAALLFGGILTDRLIYLG